MVLASNLGYPRIGKRRELKFALEKYWRDEISEEELKQKARSIKLSNWKLQSDLDIDIIPSNDFSLYDHVLDTINMVGAIPKRFGQYDQDEELATYFLMARGRARKSGKIIEARPMEMTKWFNTNYHFIVAEIEENQKYHLASKKCLEEFKEAKEHGINTRPTLLGPVSFLHLARVGPVSNLHLERLLDVYQELLFMLKDEGAQAVQFDEPCLSMDLQEFEFKQFEAVYEKLSRTRINIMLANYFSSIGTNLEMVLQLPVSGIHLDLVHGFEDLPLILEKRPSHLFLSAGVVDGRNVWITDLKHSVNLLEDIGEAIGSEKLIIAPSCSLIHVPLDLDSESNLSPDIKPWLSFAKQKLKEISILADALCLGRKEVDDLIQTNQEILADMRNSALRNQKHVKDRLKTITEEMMKRKSPFEARYTGQLEGLKLPVLPTTTIGSFPQTDEIRSMRKKFRVGEISKDEYDRTILDEIKNNISLQEEIGIDVFVHGEPERTDMVEFFAERLSGFAVTRHGWVESYGSRCVRPPIIYGDVSRPLAMTVELAKFANSLTDKPVKGMLTGPLTLLKWSYARDDQSLETTCLQISLSLRDEISELEKAGVRVIQIDEPALREAMPLKLHEQEHYLKWSVNCFRLASSAVSNKTQIHTHMCYSSFDDIIDSIEAMDADVISLEASRSNMDLLSFLKERSYSNAIGPGIYDIHSPRVPPEQEFEELLEKALAVVDRQRLWVNPDCGLKTRNWSEVIPALKAMVESACRIRKKTPETCVNTHLIEKLL